jgi:hypothetical protein
MLSNKDFANYFQQVLLLDVGQKVKKKIVFKHKIKVGTFSLKLEKKHNLKMFVFTNVTNTCMVK